MVRTRSLPPSVTAPVLTAPAHSDVPIVGTGRFTGTVTVNGSATELFFRLIDQNTGGVVDLQTVPLRIDNLDLQNDGAGAGPPAAQKITVELPGVAYDIPAGDTLALQVSTSTDSYVPNRGGAVVSLDNGKVSVPTLAPQGVAS